MRSWRNWVGLLGAAAAVTLSSNAAIATPIYQQTNLSSDIPALAANMSASLKNPWGMAFSPTSPFWIANQVTGNSTLYDGAGVEQALQVAIPAQSPTGVLFNDNTNFQVSPGSRAIFIFATLTGTIAAWNPGVGATAAVTMFSASDGAKYTGLTSAGTGASALLYAADFQNNRIDAFDTSFHQVSLAGNFLDPGLPAGFSVHNIQNIGGKLYAEYAQPGALNSGTGIVDVFDTNGNFLQRLITNTGLSSPWGITLASANFGDFSNQLLVGNFGDGTISAFDAGTGSFLGRLLDNSNTPIVNDDLWSLAFRAAGSGFDPDTLFLTAGLNDGADGLFAKIQFAGSTSTPTDLPEAASDTLFVAGLAGMFVLTRRRRGAPGTRR